VHESDCGGVLEKYVSGLMQGCDLGFMPNEHVNHFFKIYRTAQKKHMFNRELSTRLSTYESGSAIFLRLIHSLVHA
jgi:hypothetical protein